MANQSVKKRQVKNPETFRERALKVSESEDKPVKISRLKVFLVRVFGPAGKILRKLSNFKPIKLIGKIIFPSYFRSSWRELKQVTWPSWRQSRQLTFAVLLFAFIFGALIAVVDFGLDKLFRNILLK